MWYDLNIHRRTAALMQCKSGFSIVAVVIVIAIIGISLGVTTIFTSRIQDIRSERKNIDKLDDFKKAIIGNDALIINGGRSDFGYLGHMGKIPDSIENLFKIGSQTAYSFDINLKIGVGWRGPYTAPLINEYLDEYKEDDFGNDYEIINTEFVRSDGQIVAARINSTGKDGISGTADDRHKDILKSEGFSKVSGYVKHQNDQPVINIGVGINFPQDGVLSQLQTTTDANGFFSFSNITFGHRSISPGVKLIYSEGSGSAKTTGVTFIISNSGYNDVSLTSITAEYDMAGYYESIKIGNTTVWSYGTERGASGQTKTFSPVIIDGSGIPTKGVSIRVDKANVTTPDIILKGTGASKTIKFNTFKDVQTGNGTNVDMDGATFTIVFSDGSDISFILPGSSADPTPTPTPDVASNLEYLTGSGVVSGSDMDNVAFTVTNASTDNVSITSITAVYDTTAFYQQIWLESTKLFDYSNYNNTRGSSGDTKIPIPAVVVGTGNSVTIEYKTFKSKSKGNSSSVNMTGVTFTVTFSDGSEITFVAN
ncbi:MAG: hypothetical protein ACUZ8E_04610 [Candidatus Anammoxibacter sp.]